METTDDTDGTDRKGLAADGVLTPWVNRFRPSTGLIFFIRGICVIRGKSHRRFQDETLPNRILLPEISRAEKRHPRTSCSFRPSLPHAPSLPNARPRSDRFR